MLPINKPNITPDPEGDIAFLKEKLKETQSPILKKLATHIKKIWDQNQADNKPVRLEMVNLQRRVRGEYEPKKLCAIRAFQGSEAYFRTGENKARAADSWIKDIYRGDTDLPWALEPTTCPDLPDETNQQVIEKTRQQGAVIEQQLIASGQVPDPNAVSELMQQYYEESLDKAKEDLLKEAKDRCKRASDIIRDQNQEGGWNDAFKDFLYYFIRLKAGIIKGPILTKKKKQVWQSGPEGYNLVAVDTLVNDVYSVSPFNFFPSKGMKTINDGDVLEIHELSKQAISDLKDVPGYSNDEITAVLSEYGSGELKAKWFVIDDETAVKQVTKEKNYQQTTNPPTQNTTDLTTERILAQEFWGTVSGTLLVDWGMEGNIDPDVQYQVNCWKIGDHVIKAVINPDSLGRKPYHVSSWAKNPAWIWGEGLIEFAGPLEDALNAIGRALINNIAIASGPMCEVDRDRVDTKQPIYPWRQIESTSMQMKNEGPAVNYYQPQMHCNELILAWQHFNKVLDEMTVPAYAQGASQSGVTAGTATVFTQLLAAASRSIKAVVANLDDDVITPYLQMCYDYTMKFTDDDTIKGDARVVAKGVAGLLAKEQQSQRKVELLQVSANPLFAQILGQKNIGSILAQIFKANDVSLPDMDRLEGSTSAESQIQEILMAQAGIQRETLPGNPEGQIGSGGSPTGAQGMNPDGSEAGVNNG
jgi:hypothetical protein